MIFLGLNRTPEANYEIESRLSFFKTSTAIIILLLYPIKYANLSIPILAFIFVVVSNYVEGNINNGDFSESTKSAFSHTVTDDAHSSFVLMPYLLKRF